MRQHKSKVIGIRFDNETHDSLQTLANRECGTISGIIRRAVTWYLREDPPIPMVEIEAPSPAKGAPEEPTVDIFEVIGGKRDGVNA